MSRVLKGKRTVRVGVAHATLLLVLLLAGRLQAAEHITLRNGFDLVCDHRAADGDVTRLYLDLASSNYVDVRTAEIRSSEFLAATPAPQTSLAPAAGSAAGATAATAPQALTAARLHELLAGAGRAHDLDVDLLASVVQAESGGRPHARSRTGAQGLMQLMPGTAAALGVSDSYAPEENVGGGAAYLDALLHRYHDDLALALAAYNAGPAAVDRWHGIPPYRETRAYVARIIREFNRSYLAKQREATLP